MIRTATSPAAEDEKDVSKVTMRMFMFEALVQGYLSSAKSFLTPLERACCRSPANCSRWNAASAS